MQGRPLAPDAEGQEARGVIGPDERASAATLGEALLLAEQINGEDDDEGVNLAALAAEDDSILS
jgi:hypothetical protein